MQPKITNLPETKLIGQRLRMSLRDNRTAELWRSFMSRRKEIPNSINSDLYSVQVYEPSYFQTFSPGNTFEKWAAVPVSDVIEAPAGIETLTVPAGLYAVFQYKGLPGDGRIFQYIFTTWLPGSDFFLNDRPHFEVLGEKYRNGSPESEEEIWIPVKPKS